MQLKAIWSNFSIKKSNFQKLRTAICVLIFTSFGIGHSLLAQDAIPTIPTGQFGGVITATNNGVSIIPSFTLGRPAVLFDLSLSVEHFSFDPMLRFGMDGKPWSFVF